MKGVKKGMKVFVIGNKFDANYKYTHLGNDKNAIEKLINGTHEFANQIMVENAALLLGRKALVHADGYAVHTKCLELAKKMGQNAFNLLHYSASAVAGLDLGFSTQYGISQIYQKAQQNDITLTYILGADDIDFEQIKDTFIIYQGTNADRATGYADVVLPAENYTEKFASYTNNEGLVQKTVTAVNSPDECKLDSEIINLIAQKLKITLPAFEYKISPNKLEEIQHNNASQTFYSIAIESKYCKCSISRNSKTMLECEKEDNYKK